MTVNGVKIDDGTGPSPGINPWLEFLSGVLIGLALLGTVVWTWQWPVLTTVLLASVLAVQWFFKRRPGDGVAMVTAACLGTPAEIAEVSIGEWTYHGPDLVWGVPMWIPLIWANLFVLFRRLSRSILTALRGTRLGGAAWNGALLVVAVVIVGYWGLALLVMQKVPLVIGLYSVMMVITFSIWRQESDIGVYLVGAVLGAVGEYICIQLGYWHYYNPMFADWGVDITLPMDWGLSAVIINRIARAGARWRGVGVV